MARPRADEEERPIAFFEVTVAQFDADLQQPVDDPIEDERLLSIWADERERFLRDVTHVAQLMFGPEIRVQGSSRRGSLVIEVLFTARVVAKTFKEIVELIDFFSEFLQTRVPRVFAQYGKRRLTVDVHGFPGWGAVASGPETAQLLGQVPVSDAAIRAADRRFLALVGFGSLFLFLAFMAFILSLLLN